MIKKITKQNQPALISETKVLQTQAVVKSKQSGLEFIDIKVSY